MEDIRSALRDRILVLDGAMGTVLQSRGLQGNSEIFNLTHPGIIGEIHSEYIKAGVDIISTNSFGANRISQSELGLADRATDMAEAAARIARAAADKAGRKVWVAGSVGPTGKSLTLAQNIGDPVFRPYSFDEMAGAYEEQIRALVSGGADIILLETCFDALNAKAAIYALTRLFPEGDGPGVMVSVSLGDKSGRTLTGQTPEAFYRSIRHCSPLSFGLNCSLGSREMIPLIADVSRFVEEAVSCYPNAGLPDAMGEYDESPDVTAAALREMALQGSVNIVGGCCGTSPAHIAPVAAAVKGLPPRTIRSGEVIGGPTASLRSAWAGLTNTSTGARQECGKPLYVSGLESVEIDRKNNFTNIGERTNVAGSRKFARLIAAGDYGEALRVAAGQIGNGATVIDINMDDAMLDSRLEMERFLRHIAGEPEVAKAAIMIDSSHWDTLVTGLKNAQGKCVVNSISLKEGEEVFLQKAGEIKSLGAAVIVIAFDEEGQATTYQRKIDICSRAYTLLTEKAGYSPENIIFDVNVLPVGTGIPEHERYGIDFIEAVRWIKRNLPGCRTSGGISNLSFSFRGNNAVREAMHSVFLYHAIKAGLDMGIVNPGMLMIYDDIEPELLRRVEDVILDSDPGATERLIDFAQGISEAAQAGGIGGPTHATLGSFAAGISPPQSQSDSPQRGHCPSFGGDPGRGGTGAERSGASGGAERSEAVGATYTTGLVSGLTNAPSVEERLERALVKGDTSSLETDLNECLGLFGGDAFKVIDGPLMDGMARVGELFGAGKMFLPQVVKSARTMKAAVEILQPHLREGATGSSTRPKALLATVKGDVHDIGKNITGIVFTCNGFDVTDLGVMVPAADILQKAGETGADIIGVSGLITPSLYQMEQLCSEMRARGLDTPLMVGGAAASAVHTAVKLAPLYDHVFYGSDASSSAVLASKLVADREATEAAEHEKQRQLREAYEASKGRPTSTAQPSMFSPESFIKGMPFRDIPAIRLKIDEVEGHFDWETFAIILGIRPSGDRIGFRRLRGEAVRIMEDMKASGDCRIVVSARFDSAHSDGDDIVSDSFRLPMFRQPGGRSLADFVPPSEYGFDSPMGMFAISVHPGSDHVDSAASPGPDSLRSASNPGERSSGPALTAEMGETEMVRRAVILTLAEAASSWLDDYINNSIPEASGAKVIKPAIGYSSCPDHTLKRDVLRLLGSSGINRDATDRDGRDPAGQSPSDRDTADRDGRDPAGQSPFDRDTAGLGITLLESCAMIPEASICGLIFVHLNASYPEIRHLSPEAIASYASRRGMTPAEEARFLGHLL